MIILFVNRLPQRISVRGTKMNCNYPKEKLYFSKISKLYSYQTERNTPNCERIGYWNQGRRKLCEMTT